MAVLVDALCSSGVAPSLQQLDLKDLLISKEQRRRLREARGGEGMELMALRLGQDSDDESEDYGGGPVLYIDADQDSINTDYSYYDDWDHDYGWGNEAPDYTACDKECGYCGRCEY